MKLDTIPTTAPQVLQPTMRLRFVDTSTIPTSQRNILQQMFVDAETGEEVWRDVPHAGHIADLGAA